MFEKVFSSLYSLVHRQKTVVLGIVLLVTVLSGAALLVTRYEGNIDLMLPPNKEITRSMDFLRDSNLSDKVIVSLALTDPARTKKELFLACDQLAASLAPPLFTKAISGFAVGNVMEEFSILQYGPQVLGEKDLAFIDGQLNRETVNKKVKGIYLQSLRPESIFMSSLSRSDPLGIKLLFLEKMRTLPASMGYDVNIEDGHFISRDGRHAMLIIQTPVPMMDGQKSKEMIAALQERIRSLPPFVSANIICGHLHTVSNEQVIKRDITVASIFASVSFLVLFFLVFRDPRVLLVFIIPFIAVVWAVIAATGIAGQLSYLVIGFGTAIAGISIDYGLLVYIAMKRGADRSQTVKLARLVTIDACTTLFSFVALYFSMIRGYHQLALFSILCILICLILSLFVLPLTLSWRYLKLPSDPNVGERLRGIRWPARWSVAVWAVLTLVAICFSFSVRFESDVKKLDGTPPEVLKGERTFHEVWGGKENQAIFVVTGKSLEEAMEINDRVYRDAAGVIPAGDLTTLAMFYPSQKLRQENIERWYRFWRDGREEKLKSLLRENSSAYGFSDDAFAPFFDGLYSARPESASPGGIIAQLRERFVMEKRGEYRIMSYFPDEKQHLDALKPIAQKYPGSFIVSGKTLSSSISSFTIKEVWIIAPVALLFNVLLAWLFFRNWRETLLCLVPLVTGVSWLVGIMSMFNMPLNIVNIVAAVISTGVIVDYGLGITYEYRYNLGIGTVMAVTLSAATNVIGTGALLFARHPALHSTGVAMVICMVSGYLSSVIIIPSLCSLMGRSEREMERE